jgi:hypothetical protein
MRTYLLVPLAIMVVSCHKSNSNAGISYNDTHWNLGPYTYTKNYSNEAIDYIHAPSESGNMYLWDTLRVINCYGSGGTGAFTASVLNISIGNSALYTTPIDTRLKYPNNSYGSISCTIGSGAVSNTYSVQPQSNRDSVMTAIDNNGMCHINLAHPITLYLTSTTGGGIPGADTSYTLAMTDAF